MNKQKNTDSEYGLYSKFRSHSIDTKIINPELFPSNNQLRLSGRPLRRGTVNMRYRVIKKVERQIKFKSIKFSAPDIKRTDCGMMRYPSSPPIILRKPH